MKKRQFLEKHIFSGLSNKNDGFDSSKISYFTEKEFRVVLERIEKYCCGIYGIEPFLDNEFFDIRTFESSGLECTDKNWYWKAFNDFAEKNANLQYSATFYIPDELLFEETSLDKIQ